MMIYSKVLAANFESGTWIVHDSKLSNLEEPKVEYLNLESLEVENYTSDASNILGNLCPSIRMLRWRRTRGWTRTKKLYRSLSRQSIPIT